VTTAIAIALLGAVLAFATLRPGRLPEATAAVPAAVLAVALGLVSPHEAVAELRALGPTVGFLAAVLVLAAATDRAGVFRWAGAVAARASRGGARRLLAVVFVIASVTTAALSLDATVVLLTPVVLVTATHLRVRTKPPVYACTHLANTASLLLPVANLTNLLAFAASGLTFARFALVMSLPWLVAIGLEYLVFRRFFAADLAAAPDGPPDAPEPERVPRFALAVLGITLAGFAALEPLGVAPAWVALAGAVVIGVRDIAAAERGERGKITKNLALAANPAFCAFVFALGIVVRAVRDTGLGRLVGHLTPATPNLVGLLATAVLAAALANLLNNLPATLLLVPVVAHSPGLVLAVLIGVDIGPNLTYVGSLATLLWREVLHARDHAPETRTFLALGAITVPLCLGGAALALWAALHLTGTV
jgi:arsenical pump membrane protein